MESFSKTIRGFEDTTINIDVQLFTDGSCYPNPSLDGKGAGWAYVLLRKSPQAPVKASGPCLDGFSTNNRMELTAAIEGLLALDTPSRVELVTDSEYVGRGICQWIEAWRKTGFRQKNSDLWKRMDTLLRRHVVYITCIRGHQGQPENEECDRMAGEASQISKNRKTV